ncbi:MAG: DedA family protein [Dehalococcoidia bacterium]|nr:DedA family protein [Dehalococcoidia bacterium]
MDALLDIVTAPYDGWNWLADEIFRALSSLFLDLGAPIVFVAALVEATVLLGVIFPGTVVMFLAGAYSVEQDSSLALVFVMAVLGTVIGDTISYGLGRWGSGWLGGRFDDSLRMGEVLVSGHARWLIPFYHLHSVTRALGPFGSGALRFPLRIWMPLDYLGAVIANVAWVGAGALLGRAILTEDGTLEQHPALRVGLIVAGVAYFLFLQRAVLRRRGQLQEERRTGREPAG